MEKEYTLSAVFYLKYFKNLNIDLNYIKLLIMSSNLEIIFKFNEIFNNFFELIFFFQFRQ